MGTMMYNGSNISGSTNYASAISYINSEGNESTVQSELDAINEQLSSGDDEMMNEMNNMIKALYDKEIIGFSGLGFTNIEAVYVSGGGVNMSNNSYTATEKSIIFAVAQSNIDRYWTISTTGNVVVSLSGAGYGAALIEMDAGQTATFTNTGSGTWNGNAVYYKLT